MSSTMNKIFRVASNTQILVNYSSKKKDGDKNSDKRKKRGSYYKVPKVPNVPKASFSLPCLYDCRKYGHCLPTDTVMTPFEPLPCIPTGVFRYTEGERHGPGAMKDGCYKQVEYFSFHHMSYFDMHMMLRCYRMPCPCTWRKAT